MTRKLILIRHCKSDWSVGQTDHARPLNPRGQSDAPRIGRWLADQGVPIDEVLCSDATRAAQTWAGIASALPDAPPPRYLPELYHATPETLQRVALGAHGQVVAMIGHNPGILSFAWGLAETPPSEPKFGAHPTGATTVLRFSNENWAEITHGEVQHFVTPKTLP